MPRRWEIVGTSWLIRNRCTDSPIRLSFVLPVNSLIVFAAHQITYSPNIDLWLVARLSE